MNEKKDESCPGGQQCTHCECGHLWRRHEDGGFGRCPNVGCGCKKFKEKHPERTRKEPGDG
jgi:hypothetical protein